MGTMDAFFAGMWVSLASGVTPSPPEPLVVEEIDETTVGDLGGARVPMGNITRGTYSLPDGSEKTGYICSLRLPGTTGPTWVGAGSVVSVDGVLWTVLAVEKTPGQPGTVRLQRKP